MDDRQQLEIGHKLYDQLNQVGVETVLDDREARIGFKLNDADLVGYPYKVIVGKGLKDGIVELKSRKTGEVILLPTDEAAKKIKKLVQKELAKANLVE